MTQTATALQPVYRTLNSPASSAESARPSQPRHVLEFEKPLFKLEQQIHELEALQVQKQVDYSKDFASFERRIPQRCERLTTI